MKTTLVRALVLSLVFAGFTASTISSHANSKTSASLIAKGGPNPMPVPLCAPSDPSHCGMD